MSETHVTNTPSATSPAVGPSTAEQSTAPLSSTPNSAEQPEPTSAMPEPTKESSTTVLSPTSHASQAPSPTPLPQSTSESTPQPTVEPSTSHAAPTEAPTTTSGFSEFFSDPNEESSAPPSQAEESSTPLPESSSSATQPEPTQSNEEPQSTSSSSYEQPVDQPTDNSESAAVPSPTPSKAEENWTPPPSSTTEEEKPSPTPTPQTQQQMAESSPSATSGNWGEDSTNQQQQQQPSQTYESTSENWVANAVESEAVTNLTTSSIYQEAGTARTSTWVYSTTYSMVKSPVRTVTASGKVGTKVAVVAGSSTATTLTATGSTNPTSYASNSSDGSLSKGGIAGVVVGCLAAVVAILLLLFSFCKRRRSGALKLRDEDQYGISPRSGLKRNGTQHSALDFSDGPLHGSRQPTCLEPVPEMPESAFQRVSKDGEWEYASDDAHRSPVTNADSDRFTHYDDWLAYEYANSPFSEKHAIPETTTMAQVGGDDNVSVTIKSPKNTTNSMYGIPFDAYGNAYANPAKFVPKLHAGPSIQSLHSVSTVEQSHMGFSGEICSTDDSSSMGHGSMSHATSASQGHASLRGQAGHLHSASGTFGIAR